MLTTRKAHALPCTHHLSEPAESTEQFNTTRTWLQFASTSFQYDGKLARRYQEIWYDSMSHWLARKCHRVVKLLHLIPSVLGLCDFQIQLRKRPPQPNLPHTSGDHDEVWGMRKDLFYIILERKQTQQNFQACIPIEILK